MESLGASLVLEEVDAAHRVMKFVIALIPKELGDSCLKLSEQVVSLIGQKLPQKVYWYFPNGDVFECRYCHVRLGFVGCLKALTKYKAKTYSVLSFDHITPAEFYVSLINPSGVENVYAPISSFVPYEVEFGSYLRYLQEGIAEDAINSNGVKLNCKTGWEPRLVLVLGNGPVVVREPEVILERRRVPQSYWFNTCTISLSTPLRAWEVHVEKENKMCTLTEGWNEFVIGAGLGSGDLLLLEREGNPFHFQVAVIKGYTTIFNDLREGAYKPLKFMRFVTAKMRRSGETFVPLLFCHKYWLDWAHELELHSSSGKAYRVSFCQSELKISGLQNILADYQRKDPSLMIFRYEGIGKLSVTVFNTDQVECVAE